MLFIVIKICYSFDAILGLNIIGNSTTICGKVIDAQQVRYFFLYICFFVQRVERVKSNLAHFIVFRVILNYIVGIEPRSFRKFLLL